MTWGGKKVWALEITLRVWSVHCDCAIGQNTERAQRKRINMLSVYLSVDTLDREPRNLMNPETQIILKQINGFVDPCPDAVYLLYCWVNKLAWWWCGTGYSGFCSVPLLRMGGVWFIQVLWCIWNLALHDTSAKWGVHILHIKFWLTYFAICCIFCIFWDKLAMFYDLTYFAYFFAYSAYLLHILCHILCIFFWIFFCIFCISYIFFPYSLHILYI